MDLVGGRPDPLLLQMAATLAEIKTGQVHQAEVLREILKDIRDFDTKIVALQHDMAQAKHDLTKRTHTEDTERLKQDVRALQEAIPNKAPLWLVRMLIAILIVEFTAITGTAIKMALFSGLQQ